MNHRVPFLWRFHKVHHSDPHMDVSTANRFHFGEIILSSILRIPVILLLGAELWHLALYEAILYPVVQFHHANIGVGRRLDRFLRLFITTPEMHKAHHSRWQPETDSNYTSLLSIWDRVFRSFRLRKDPHEIQLGLDGYDEPQKQTLWGLLRTPLGKSDLPERIETWRADHRVRPSIKASAGTAPRPPATRSLKRSPSTLRRPRRAGCRSFPRSRRPCWTIERCCP